MRFSTFIQQRKPSAFSKLRSTTVSTAWYSSLSFRSPEGSNYRGGEAKSSRRRRRLLLPITPSVSTINTVTSSTVPLLSFFTTVASQRRSYSMISTMWGGKPLRLEVGRIGPLADAVVFASHGDTTILASAVSNTTMTTEDFLPLQVEYRERISAYGSIPSTNNRKEPTVNEKEILAARVIDRTLRPLFQKGYLYDTQIITTLQSYDPDCDPIALAIIASSAALHISPIPWDGPAAAVRVGLPSSTSSSVSTSSSSPVLPILSPNAQQQLDSPLEFLYAGADEVALMIEAEGKEIPEQTIAQIIRYSQQSLSTLLNLQNELRTMIGKPKRNLPLCLPSDELLSAVERVIYEEAKETFRKARNRKEDRSRAQGILQKEAKVRLPNRYQNDDPRKISAAAEMIIRQAMRDVVIETARFNSPTPSPFPGPTITAPSQYKLYDGENCRVDGRSTKEIRKLQGMVDILPRVHGSGLFSRGDTQVLTTATLGPVDLALDIDLENSLQTQHSNRQEENSPTLTTTTVSNSTLPVNKSVTDTPAIIGKRFFLHYDFPPYCTNEVSKMGGINRRMIGHGALAEKSLRAVLPKDTDLVTWPYTVRVTSETTGSDGSSSMATVCGATLALMDAGVPISAPVAGISIGCMSPTSENQGGMKPGDSYVLLTDIFGLEDHAGDMDFKIAGTRNGITGIQLDMKPAGLPVEVLEAAVWRAKDARYQILDVITNAIPTVRKELKPFTPKAEILELPSELRPKLIGPGGSNLRRTERLSGAKIVLDPDAARLFIYANSKEMDIAKTVLFAAAQEQLRAIGSPLTVHLQPRKLPSLVVGVPIRAQILRTTEFGVVIGLNNEEIGWMHISEFARHRNHKVNEYFTDGDEVTVQVCDVDAKGRGRFSIKALLNAGEDISKYIVHKSKSTTDTSTDKAIIKTETMSNSSTNSSNIPVPSSVTTSASVSSSSSTAFSTTINHVKAGEDIDVLITKVTAGGISLGVISSSPSLVSPGNKYAINSSSTTLIHGLSITEIGWMARATLPLPKQRTNIQELFTVGDILRLRVVRGVSNTTGYATFSIRPLLKDNQSIETLLSKYTNHSTPVVLSPPSVSVSPTATIPSVQSSSSVFTTVSTNVTNPNVSSITAPSTNTIWREFSYLENGIIQGTNTLRLYNLLPVNQTNSSSNSSNSKGSASSSSSSTMVTPSIPVVAVPVMENDNVSSPIVKVMNTANKIIDNSTMTSGTTTVSSSSWSTFSNSMQQQNVLKGTPITINTPTTVTNSTITSSVPKESTITDNKGGSKDETVVASISVSTSKNKNKLATTVVDEGDTKGNKKKKSTTGTRKSKKSDKEDTLNNSNTSGNGESSSKKGKDTSSESVPRTPRLKKVKVTKDGK